MTRTLISLCMAFSLGALGFSQLAQDKPSAVPDGRNSSEILWAIQKLGTLGKVLYVAAHPDDENTALISYLSLGGKYDTAYLSLTRGDGGQNLIGPELRDKLGVIRTQELLSARKIDGGRQFFTRAKDFGFSKTAEETLRIWDEEAVLADVVWVIRNFQPDVIVTRFGPEGGFTHGHHTASCLLAMEAFDAAADPQRFPEQLDKVEVWQAKRVVWNASSWHFRRSGQAFDESEYVALDVGGYDPLLGRSYNEIASLSRSQHRSQGFGSAVDRGSRMEYFQLLKGESMTDSIFDGVATDWSRVDDGEGIAQMIGLLEAGFDPNEPSASVERLIALRERLAASKASWAEGKIAELDGIIASCLGLSVLATAPEPVVLPGETLSVAAEVLNRSPLEVTLREAKLRGNGDGEQVNRRLEYNTPIEVELTAPLPNDLQPSQPYWLAEEGSLGMFAVENPWLIGLPDNPPAFVVDLVVEVAEKTIPFRAPVVYREVDPALGETLRPVEKGLAASVSFDAPVQLFANHQPKEVSVTVSAPFATVAGELRLELPEGWSASPESHRVDRLEQGGQASYRFTVKPPERPEEANIRAVLSAEDGKTYDRAVSRIRYDHIPNQLVFEPSVAKAVSLQVEKRGERVGYLPGAGDTVPESIEEIGYEVSILEPAAISRDALQQLDAVVIGIRAYNTVEEIDRVMPLLFDYVREGGTLIAQYNTSHQLKTDRLAPFPLGLSRDRVTDEKAEMRILAPDHPALNRPNKIGPADFEGWTQERGLYFPNRWDETFVPLLSSNDPGEAPSEGSLLVAQYGEGYFVYTGLSWFRQLPAGVPGAYRLFANLLSLGNE